jgi:hypothetical protein
MKYALTKFFFHLLFITLGVSQAFSQTYNILDFGAQVGPDFNNTAPINEAIKKCSESGGGKVLIPKGKFITGTIHLLSNVNLHLENGAVLVGSLDMSHYNLMPEGYYYSGINYMGILFANDVKNVSLTGAGTIDGRGTFFMKKNKRFAPSAEERKYTRQKEQFRDPSKLEDGPLTFIERPGHILTLSNAENIRIKDLLFLDSPKWTLRVGGCEDVKISEITIKNNVLIANSDGIHITSSSNVQVSNSTVIAGDDALIVTGFISGNKKYTYGNQSNEAKNIIFDNCIITSKSAGIRVGYGIKPIKNIIFSNIIITDSNRGIGVFSRDNSAISEVSFSNIKMDLRLHSDGWWGKSEPIHISAIPSSPNGAPGKIKNISFSDIQAHSESGVILYGEDENLIENIKMTRVHFQIDEGKFSQKYGGNFDLRPAFSLEKGLFKNDIPAFYAKRVKGLELNHITLEWKKPTSKFYTNGLEIENFERFILKNFNISAANVQENIFDIKLSKGTDYKIFNDLSFGKETKILYPDK